jgi:hypothetical protein
MKGGICIDPEVPHLVGTHFALVNARRGARKRFPETCVEVVPDADTARRRAAPEQDLHGAEVVGPSRSSEGVRLYYLVRWLED